MMAEQDGANKEPTKYEKLKRIVEDFGPMTAMFVIIGFVIFVVSVVLFSHDHTVIVVRSQGGPADFNASSALAYAERVSHVAEMTVGGILTLALALVGFSWLSNNARVERDRQELVEHKANLDRQLAEHLERQKLDTESRITSLSDDVVRRHLDIQESIAKWEDEIRDLQVRERATTAVILKTGSSQVRSDFRPNFSVHLIEQYARDGWYERCLDVFLERIGSWHWSSDFPSVPVDLIPNELLWWLHEAVQKIAPSALSVYSSKISSILESWEFIRRTGDGERLVGQYDRLDRLISNLKSIKDAIDNRTQE